MSNRYSLVQEKPPRGKQSSWNCLNEKQKTNRFTKQSFEFKYMRNMVSEKADLKF